MKKELTIEQSQRLIELGVDLSKASAIRYNISETEVYCGYAREIVVVDGYIDNYLSKEPVFTLTDILSLLPREIDAAWLYMSYQDGIEWAAAYESYDYGGNQMYEHYFIATEFIDALYELLIWVLQNHPETIKKLCR